MKIGKERASVWSLFFSGGVGFFIRALSRGSMGAGLRRFAPTILYPVRFLKPQTSSIQRTKSSVRCTFHSPQSPLARWVRLGLLYENLGLIVRRIFPLILFRPLTNLLRKLDGSGSSYCRTRLQSSHYLSALYLRLVLTRER